MSGDDPPAAMLTNAQRKWLSSERDYSPSTERQLRARLRERVRQSFGDFIRLVESDVISDEQLREALVSESGQGMTVPPWGVIAFLYTVAPEDRPVRDIPEEPAELPDKWATSETPPREAFLEWAVEDGIRKSILHREDSSVEDVDVAISVDRGIPFDDLEEADLSRLPRDLLDQLLHVGSISDAEYGKAIKQRLERAERGDPTGLTEVNFAPADPDDE